MNSLTAKSERPYHCRASSFASASDEADEARPPEYRGIGSGRSGLILMPWRMAMWIMSSLISRGESGDLDFHDLRLVPNLH
jgi:hypothetical protein